jgi:hypothetical protein
VSFINEYAFADCTSLTDISFPFLQSTGSSCFQNCISLSSVSLPNISIIGDATF